MRICILVLAIATALPVRSIMAQRCRGDCSGDGKVTVDEVVTMVKVALDGRTAPMTAASATSMPSPRSAGSPTRFTDNGDGTITDHQTGLMWEKKSADLSIHDWRDWLDWCADDNADGQCDTPGGSPDGSVFTYFISGLNKAAFAAHTDWRLPTVDELDSIRDLNRVHPAIDPVFHRNCIEGCKVTDCSCTGFESTPSAYWSSTTTAGNPNQVWIVHFDGYTCVGFKAFIGSARAVRGGW